MTELHEGHEDFMARELEARGELINMDFSKLEERVIANLPESAQQKFLDAPYGELCPEVILQEDFDMYCDSHLQEMKRGINMLGRRGLLIPRYVLNKNGDNT